MLSQTLFHSTLFFAGKWASRTRVCLLTSYPELAEQWEQAARRIPSLLYQSVHSRKSFPYFLQVSNTTLHLT